MEITVSLLPGLCPGSVSRSTMNKLKVICLNLTRLGRQVCSLPHTIVNSGKRRRQRAIVNENEVERLDRIRNPSKYLGK